MDVSVSKINLLAVLEVVTSKSVTCPCKQD